jgi:hypothetical protein
MVLIYTHLQAVSFWVVVAVNVVLFIGIFSRIIPFQAMVTSVPDANQRGAFSAISASTQQLSGGVASILAGHIIALGPDGKLQNFDTVGYVVIATTLISIGLVWQVQKGILARNPDPEINTGALR